MRSSGLARLRQRDAQTEQPNAADRLDRIDPIETFSRRVALDQVRVERVHRRLVLPEEVHDALEAVLLVVRVEREVRASVELLPSPIRADPRFGAVVDRDRRRPGEERSHLQEVVRDARKEMRRQRAADPVEPDAGEVRTRKHSQRDLRRFHVERLPANGLERRRSSGADGRKQPAEEAHDAGEDHRGDDEPWRGIEEKTISDQLA